MKDAAGPRRRVTAPGKEQGDDPVIKAKRGGAGARAQRSVGKKKRGGKRAREGRWREEKRRDAIGLKQNTGLGGLRLKVAGLC